MILAHSHTFKWIESSIMYLFSIFLFLFCLLIYSEQYSRDNVEKYLNERQMIINEEQSMAFGAKIVLNHDEERANNVLMKYKNEELHRAFENSKSFLPSKNFLQVSDAITRSKVYQFIRKMPKGGVLHAHISAINSRDFILRNITRRPNLYVCRKLNFLELRFSDEIALRKRNDCTWDLLEKARMKDKSIDKEISEALTMYSDDPFRIAKGIDDAWKKFLSIFYFIKSLVTYRPVYEDFLYHIMEEMYEDNVQFIEVRTSFSSLYELNGYQHNYAQVAEIYRQVIDRFVKDHPDFMGVKWIYSPQRNIPRSKFVDHVKRFQQLRKKYPNHIVGFDLVGQEDKGRPLKDFAAELLNMSADTRFYFHAGETNWSGLKTDENLIDAVLLNAKRIGHGYALLKHPKLIDLIKRKNIAIEVSPISNQVLKLVKDLRNHPAAYFFAENLPVVISNDDPGFWDARALSYDFYEAFMGIMSSRADLRALKQLAINSIDYGSFNDAEKRNVSDDWKRRWDHFIADVVNDIHTI